jgi:phage head maturation protease
MADALLDRMRHDALQKRIHGIAGDHRIMWSPRDLRAIHNRVASLSETSLRAAPAPAPISRKGDAGIAANEQIQSSDRSFLFRISSSDIDRAGDSIAPGGIDWRDYLKNPVVLNSHNSEAAPIARSTAPWVAGGAVFAIAHFPEKGLLADSDEIADCIREGILRGCSVGFVPVRWSFSKDPGRPIGIDFHETKLLEWSTCSLPCNPHALLQGAVSAKSANGRADLAERRREEARMDRIAEARRLAHMAKLI